MKNLDSVRFHIPLLVVLTFLVFANGLHGAFVFDDMESVIQNKTITNVRTIGDVLHAGTGSRELLISTYALNYLLGGADTFGYHLVNILLHMMCVLLVYFIIRELTEGMPSSAMLAFWGAAVFSVHTLLTGAVSYVSGRSSILCGLFYFAAILCFLKTSRDKRYFILTAVFAFLAWETKQEAITLPIALAGLAFLRSDKRDWRVIAVLSAIPLVGVFLMRDQLQRLYSTVTGNAGLVNGGFEAVLPAGMYFRTYLTAVVGYILPRFAFPVSLSIDPYVRPVEHWYSVEFLFVVAVFGAIAWIFVRYGLRDRLLGSGMALLFLSPLTAYVVIPLSDIVQEHRAYIPALGAVTLFVWVFRRVHWAVPVAIVVVFSFLTIGRNSVWNDELSLWKDAAEKAPTKPRAHFNLGASYQKAGRAADAIREYRLALEIKPDIYAAYSNMSALLVDNGQFDEAEKSLLKVTSLAPNYTDGFINLGVLYMREGQPEKSIVALNRAVEMNPDNFAAHLNRAEVLTQLGDFKGALEDYKTAVYLRRDLPSLRIKLGGGYLRAGDRVAAEKEYFSVTDTPDAAEAYRYLAIMYNDAGDTDKAIDYVTRALRERPIYPDAHQELAVMYIKKQQLDAAIHEFETALAQKPDHGAAVQNLALAYQLKGDAASARAVLENFLRRFGPATPYSAQVQARLNAMNATK